MKIEKRLRRTEVNGIRLQHHDLVLIPDSEEESQLIDLLGIPDSYVQGQIRLADGYGQHYILLQPRLKLMPDSKDFREFSEPDDLKRRLEFVMTAPVPTPQRAETPVQRKTESTTPKVPSEERAKGAG